MSYTSTIFSKHNQVLKNPFLEVNYLKLFKSEYTMKKSTDVLALAINLKMTNPRDI